MEQLDILADDHFNEIQDDTISQVLSDITQNDKERSIPVVDTPIPASASIPMDQPVPVVSTAQEQLPPVSAATETQQGPSLYGQQVPVASAQELPLVSAAPIQPQQVSLVPVQQQQQIQTSSSFVFGSTTFGSSSGNSNSVQHVMYTSHHVSGPQPPVYLAPNYDRSKLVGEMMQKIGETSDPFYGPVFSAIQTHHMTDVIPSLLAPMVVSVATGDLLTPKKMIVDGIPLASYDRERVIYVCLNFPENMTDKKMWLAANGKPMAVAIPADENNPADKDNVTKFASLLTAFNISAGKADQASTTRLGQSAITFVNILASDFTAKTVRFYPLRMAFQDMMSPVDGPDLSKRFTFQKVEPGTVGSIGEILGFWKVWYNASYEQLPQLSMQYVHGTGHLMLQALENTLGGNLRFQTIIKTDHDPKQQPPIGPQQPHHIPAQITVASASRIPQSFQMIDPMSQLGDGSIFDTEDMDNKFGGLTVSNKKQRESIPPPAIAQKKLATKPTSSGIKRGPPPSDYVEDVDEDEEETLSSKKRKPEPRRDNTDQNGRYVPPAKSQQQQRKISSSSAINTGSKMVVDLTPVDQHMSQKTISEHVNALPGVKALTKELSLDSGLAYTATAMKAYLLDILALSTQPEWGNAIQSPGFIQALVEDLDAHLFYIPEGDTVFEKRATVASSRSASNRADQQRIFTSKGEYTKDYLRLMQVLKWSKQSGRLFYINFPEVLWSHLFGISEKESSFKPFMMDCLDRVTQLLDEETDKASILYKVRYPPSPENNATTTGGQQEQSHNISASQTAATVPSQDPRDDPVQGIPSPRSQTFFDFTDPDSEKNISKTSNRGSARDVQPISNPNSKEEKEDDDESSRSSPDDSSSEEEPSEKLGGTGTSKKPTSAEGINTLAALTVAREILRYFFTQCAAFPWEDQQQQLKQRSNSSTASKRPLKPQAQCAPLAFKRIKWSQAECFLFGVMMRCIGARQYMFKVNKANKRMKSFVKTIRKVVEKHQAEQQEVDGSQAPNNTEAIFERDGGFIDLELLPAGLAANNEWQKYYPLDEAEDLEEDDRFWKSRESLDQVMIACPTIGLSEACLAALSDSFTWSVFELYNFDNLCPSGNANQVVGGSSINFAVSPSFLKSIGALQRLEQLQNDENTCLSLTHAQTLFKYLRQVGIFRAALDSTNHADNYNMARVFTAELWTISSAATRSFRQLSFNSRVISVLGMTAFYELVETTLKVAKLSDGAQDMLDLRGMRLVYWKLKKALNAIGTTFNAQTAKRARGGKKQQSQTASESPYLHKVKGNGKKGMTRMGATLNLVSFCARGDANTDGLIPQSFVKLSASSDDGKGESLERKMVGRVINPIPNANAEIPKPLLMAIPIGPQISPTDGPLFPEDSHHHQHQEDRDTMEYDEGEHNDEEEGGNISPVVGNNNSPTSRLTMGEEFFERACHNFRMENKATFDKPPQRKRGGPRPKSTEAPQQQDDDRADQMEEEDEGQQQEDDRDEIAVPPKRHVKGSSAKTTAAAPAKKSSTTQQKPPSKKRKAPPPDEEAEEEEEEQQQTELSSGGEDQFEKPKPQSFTVRAKAAKVARKR